MGILGCYSTIAVVRGKSLSDSIAYVKKLFILIQKKHVNQFEIG